MAQKEEEGTHHPNNLYGCITPKMRIKQTAAIFKTIPVAFDV
jgi:hypothetical protein